MQYSFEKWAEENKNFVYEIYNGKLSTHPNRTFRLKINGILSVYGHLIYESSSIFLFLKLHPELLIS